MVLGWFEEGEGPEAEFDEIGGESPFFESEAGEEAIEDESIDEYDSEEAAEVDIGLFVHEFEEVEAACGRGYE